MLNPYVFLTIFGYRDGSQWLRLVIFLSYIFIVTLLICNTFTGIILAGVEEVALKKQIEDDASATSIKSNQIPIG